MADLATSAAAASILVGLMTIPAASSTIDSSATVSEQLPEISNSNDTPSEFTRKTTSDGFKASIETAFDKFTVTASSDSTTAELEQPTDRLNVEKTPSSTIWTLTTSEGKLEVEKTNSNIKETVTTPSGTLTVINKNNGQERSFEGEDRQKTLATYHELHDLLEQKKQRLDQKRDKIEKRSLPEIAVEVNKSTASGLGNNTEEFAKIVNNDVKTVNIGNWQLSDDSSDTELPSIELGPGETIRVYTESEEDLEISEEAIYDSGIAWNNQNDVAELVNRKGQTVDETSY